MCLDTFLRSKPPSDMDTVKRSTVVQLLGLPRSEWTRHDNSSSNSLAILALGPFWSILDPFWSFGFDHVLSSFYQRFIIVLSCFIWICSDMLTIVNFSSYSFVCLKPFWKIPWADTRTRVHQPGPIPSTLGHLNQRWCWVVPKYHIVSFFTPVLL